MQINVEAPEIARGKRRSRNECPVALTLKKEHKRVCVEHWHLRVGDEWFEIPAEGRRFIRRFNQGAQKVTPISLKVRKIPEAYLHFYGLI